MAVRCKCSYCQQHYEIDDADVNLLFQCPRCGNESYLGRNQLPPKKKCYKNKWRWFSICLLPFVIGGVFLLFSIFPLPEVCAQLKQNFVDTLSSSDKPEPNELSLKFTYWMCSEEQAKNKAVEQAIHDTLCKMEQRSNKFGIVGKELFPAEATKAVVAVQTTPITKQSGESTKSGFEVTVTLSYKKLQDFSNVYWYTAEILSGDIQQLFNTRNNLKQYSVELDNIFRDYPQRIYSCKRLGMFEVSKNDNANSQEATFKMTYELSFEKQEYNKLSKRLKNLLEKVAIQKEVGRDLTYNQICGYGGAFRKFNEKNSESWPSGTETVSFCEEYLINGEKKYSYAIYAVPKQIRKKIDNLISSDSVLVFQFQLKDGSKRIGMLQPRLSFFEYDNGTLSFRNWLGAKIPNYAWKYFSKQEYERDWSFSEDVIRNMKSCTIKAYSGKQADYLWYLHRGDSYNMKSLANRGYIPAMIAMAEVFKGSGWYEAAALVGSRYAQEKLSWQNSGLGFSLDKDGAWYVTSSQKNVPVKKGMKIKLLNGENIERWDYEKLSQYIGAMSPGTSVSVELYDGRKFKVDIKIKNKFANRFSKII